jgi:mono/diheme cytochrome c family protein
MPIVLTSCALAAALVGCPKPPLPSPDPQAALVEEGRRLFFAETFGGNGRTCGTCHPAENDFTLDPAFIARLPANDPLFVAEFVPALARSFENPRLMREFGLILENLDGFDDLERSFVMRGIPHTLALATSVASPQGPRTGWSGDGAPGDGSLRSFATGAVIQHFTRSLSRVAGVDFRLPTDEELDALEAFQLSLGRQRDLALPLALEGTVPRRGQEIFLDDRLGKCGLCHANAGANARTGGNSNFDTGVENLPDRPAKLTGEPVPPDDGLGRPGDRTFNTPPLVEAASTPPFFHDNSVETLEAAVAFYDGDAFNASPAGRFLKTLDPAGKGIELDATQISAVAAFLRVLNALEAIRRTGELLATSEAMRKAGHHDRTGPLVEAKRQLGVSARVLSEGGLHPAAVRRLEEARRLVGRRLEGACGNELQEAIEATRSARAELVE